MCMFAFDVNSVDKTKIFTAVVQAPFNRRQKRQLIVYKNKVAKDVKTGKPIVMVLPFPRSAPNVVDVNLHSMQSDAKTDFFDYVDDCFAPIPRPKSAFFNGKVHTLGETQELPVQQSGSYKVSIVPSLREMGFLSKKTFGDMTPFLEYLDKHYNKTAQWFGFIVAYSDAENADFDPLAYSFAIPDDCKSLFVPTRHRHGSDPSEEVDAHWNHKIYVCNALSANILKMTDVLRIFSVGISTTIASEVQDGLLNPRRLMPVDTNTLLDVKDLKFAPCPISQIRKYEINGVWENKDLTFDVDNQSFKEFEEEQDEDFKPLSQLGKEMNQLAKEMAPEKSQKNEKPRRQASIAAKNAITHSSAKKKITKKKKE